MLIDKAIEYIEAKNANYLAKEGQVVFFTSDSGRKSDEVWVKHSMTETIRIIRATRLSTDCELREHHVLAAFQELGRVFEYGAKSRHKLTEGVFNYLENSNTKLSNLVASSLVEALIMRGIPAVLGSEVFRLYGKILAKVGSEERTKDTYDVLLSAFAVLGFEYKVGSRRVLYKGTKMNAFMRPDSKPSQIVSLVEIESKIDQQVCGELK